MNVDKLRAAMTRPDLTIAGITVTGKLLSWPRWTYWVGRLGVWYGTKSTIATPWESVDRIITGTGTGEDIAALRAWREAKPITDAEAKKDVMEFVTELGLPGEQFVELEAPLVQKGIADFFDLHRQAFESVAAAAPSN